MRNRQFAYSPLVAALATLLFVSFVGDPGRAAEPPAATSSVDGIELIGDWTAAPVAFAAEEIRSVAAGRGLRLAISLEIDPTSLESQCYRIERTPAGSIRVTGGDAAGAMYGGLDVAEAVRLEALPDLAAGERKPHVERRGIKFNIPLDLRTPSYSDCSDSFQANIPEMWSMDFWREMLDEMARHRFNVLSLWSLHPFPSIVKVPEYPDVALDDVWRTRTALDGSFSLTGSDMVRPAMLADYEIVKRITIDEKIRFWQNVMQHAARPRHRGVLVHLEHLRLGHRRQVRHHRGARQPGDDRLLPRQRARDGAELSAAGGYRHHGGRADGGWRGQSQQGAVAVADVR
jgi:hypothetical protein